MTITYQPQYVSTRNACKLCSPLGACLAMRGVEGCVPLIHGSQGCATYIRRYGISHFREPIDIASSNFVEATAIFGGKSNLFQALDNITRQYTPSVIGITSTCLSETIGEDVEFYLREYAQSTTLTAGLVPLIFSVSTPSYQGTHLDGFHKTIYSLIRTITEAHVSDVTAKRINVMSNFVSAEDLRELHSILQSFELPYTLVPDYSETLDGGAWAEYQKLPQGGTKIGDIQRMPRSTATMYLGKAVEPGDDAGQYLQERFGVPSKNVELPIGINNTDTFFDTLEIMTGKKTPPVYEQQRLRLVDAYFDGHKYCSGKKAIVYGDEDMTVALVSFLDEIGVTPVIAATGAPGAKFSERIESVTKNSRVKPTMMPDTDFVTILEACKDSPVDFLLGNSKGLYLARELNVPLVRCGFPIHDRLGGHRILHLGYRGTLNLFERICNALMEESQNEQKHGWTYV